MGKLKRVKAAHSKPVALITGGASFLGKAISLKLAHEGYNLVLHYQHSGAKTKLWAKELENHGAQVGVVQSDLKISDRLPSLASTRR